MSKNIVFILNSEQKDQFRGEFYYILLLKFSKTLPKDYPSMVQLQHYNTMTVPVAKTTVHILLLYL